MNQLAKEHSIKVFYPKLQFCTDNGAMIAYAGLQRLIAGEQDGAGFSTTPRWPLDTLNVPL